MRVKGTAGLALCAALGLMLACPQQADAAQQRSSGRSAAPATQPRTHAAPARSQHATAPHRQHVRVASHAGARHAGTARSGRSRGTAVAASAASYGGISCVPYARMVTGMNVSGNGGQWWYNASGTYARGQRPEPGSVLAFPGSGGMRRGHVAVVSKVHGPRHIEIDHANWGGPGIRRGSVMRNVDVIDVSERNDWTQVRVQVGWEQGNFGRAYPTYGFIYNRPDRGMMTAFTGVSPATAQPVSAVTGVEEVAELPRTAPSRRAGSTRSR